ncbi:YebC/PmpR family DNA-binding transcriptional regulator [Patescibacteria group bacterium]|nr:YebC/PmpR family DNA-binding transcriptional regulator [Patescibacteria group bacterium]
MSGHSKWATTKNKKEAADSKRSNLFTKLARNISVAARSGGDPDMNFSLRIAVDKSKAAGMPKENIERAIKRGSGESSGESIEEFIYEGFGSSGVALIIEGVTDNRNRTLPEIKSILTKAGGSIGAQNSVKWMFEHKGVIHLNSEQSADKDTMMLELIDMGAADVAEEENGLTAYCLFEDFEKLKKALEAKGVNPEYAEVEWVAKEPVAVSEETREKIETLMETLESQDDVNNVYANMK